MLQIRARRRIRHWTGGLFLVLVCAGNFACVSARMSDHESDRLFRFGRYEEAAARLKKGAESQGESGRDYLLYLLDMALSLHSAGKYDESIQAFLKADQIADIKDYTSLATESATLLTSDNIKDYKGEDFEKVLINTYLAMNYALIGSVEDALVEARRVNHKLHLMVTEGKRKYKQNAFARYLSAILYEMEGNFNDAYIDYQNAYQLIPSLPGIGRDLWRCAWQLRLEDEMEKWDQTFHLTPVDHQEAKKIGPQTQQGEIIVLYENGISPIKRPNPQFNELPKFYPRYNPVRFASVLVNGENKGSTVLLEDIEATAMQNLEEKYAGLIAKKIAGIVVKEGIAYAIERQTDNRLLGAVARMAFYLSDQADLRSWNLLPRDLQIARIPVPPGTYKIQALPGGRNSLPEKVVQVGSGKKVFVSFRYMP